MSKPKITRTITIEITVDVSRDVDRPIGKEVDYALDYVRLIHDKCPMGKDLEIPYSLHDYGNRGPTTFKITHSASDD